MDAAVTEGQLNEHQSIRPFLKWAGNKYRVIERIKKLLPRGSRLIEPFVLNRIKIINERVCEHDNILF